MQNTDQAEVDPENASNDEANESGVNTDVGITAGESPQQEQLDSDLEIANEDDFWAIAEALPDSDPESDSNETASDSDDEGEAEGSLEEDDDPPGTDEDEGDDAPAEDIAEEDYIKRFYAKHRPKMEQYALSLIARNKEMTLSEALEVAQRKFGAEENGSDEQHNSEDSNQLPQTVEDLESEIERLEKEREEADEELRDDDYRRLTKEIEALLRKKPDVLNREREMEDRANAQYEQAFDVSMAKAKAYYPFIANPDSPESKRLLEIEQALVDMDDPLLYDTDKPLKLAQMVAREFGIAPKSPQSQPKKPEVSQPRRKKATPVAPASGNSRTNQPSQIDNNKQVEQELENISNEDDYFAAMQRLGFDVD